MVFFFGDSFSLFLWFGRGFSFIAGESGCGGGWVDVVGSLDPLFSLVFASIDDTISCRYKHIPVFISCAHRDNVW
ncbi:hypothetical protein DFP73DRAFT_534035 [Morchella snyderi]|nr:hypothetical protein DFP73DRAFT_534035 [Morchella snyderi]